MTLLEAIRELDALDDANTIYAAEPWTPESQVLVAPESSKRTAPREAAERGLKYFIEVFLAKEFLQGWAQSLGTKPTIRDACLRLIRYAIDDA